jgi:hypothetical protein
MNNGKIKKVEKDGLDAAVKTICENCSWQGEVHELLTASNPFDDSTIWGCPRCKSVDCFVRACDALECWAQSECGTPTPDGYRFTCSAHKPEDAE